MKDLPVQNFGAGRPLKIAAAVKRAEELGNKLLAQMKSESAIVAAAEEVTSVVQMKNKGGRPFQAEECLVDRLESLQCVLAAGDVSRSNRRAPGTLKKRREETAATKLIMCKEMEKMQVSAANRREFAAAAVMKYNIPWKRLETILKNKDVWQQLVADRKLGKGFNGSSAARGVRSTLSKTAKKMEWA